MDHFLQIVIAGNFFLAICRSGQQFCNLSFRTVFLEIVVVNHISTWTIYVYIHFDTSR